MDGIERTLIGRFERIEIRLKRERLRGGLKDPERGCDLRSGGRGVG
jgi:hypothetical protein